MAVWAYSLNAGGKEAAILYSLLLGKEAERVQLAGHRGRKVKGRDMSLLRCVPTYAFQAGLRLDSSSRQQRQKPSFRTV